ncbi:MAG: hypothetical protein LBD22_03015 [Spirochaetaceae bacterium]|nr:hypothetical protein [Spirochaetaceae bacterium]
MTFRKYLPRSVRLKAQEIHYKVYGCKMPWSALRFEIHLTDKCNLNCAGCIHFSSLCGELNLLDINVYESDIKRISALTGGICADIRILGGEPLLHPEVAGFLELTRKYFPVCASSDIFGKIELVTNGILLPKQPDRFWTVCAENNIIIVVSEYPVALEKEYIRKTARKFGVQIKLMEESCGVEMTGSANQWVKIPLDIQGKQNYRKSFGACFLGGICFQLVKGKIYKCARIAYIAYFNKYFNQNLEVAEDDYVDIYKAPNSAAILNELIKPARLCRYCKARNITWDNQWKKSKKILDEYL